MKLESDEIFDSLISDVQACVQCVRMCESKRVLNRGCGPTSAQILVIGEAPGRLGADASSLPFHGDRAGNNFETLMETVGIRRDQLFITNAALCNPKDSAGNNATPTDAELRSCSTFLRRQVDLVDPRIVVTLGAVALKAIEYIQAHGLSLRSAVRSSTKWYGRELIPLYHPGQRAMIHRSFANQLSDYHYVAERFKRLGSVATATSGKTKPDIAAVAKAILLRGGARSYFSLHKICYLTELSFARVHGKRMTQAYFIRQKDGPYCVDLQLQRLKRTGLHFETSSRAGKLWISLSAPGMFNEDAETAVLEALESRVIDDVLAKYSDTTDERLKTISYITSPMRKILRYEQLGSNQLNAPISFE